MSFNENLSLLIIDKGIIGLLILLAGFVLNKAIEKYKSKKLIETEIKKKSLEKLEDVCNALVDYERCVLGIHLNRFLILQTEVMYIVGISEYDNNLKKYINENPDDEFDKNMLSQPERDTIESHKVPFEKKLKEFEQIIELEAEKYLDIMEKNRMWLSKSQYKKINEFFERLLKSINRKFENAKDIENYMEFQKDLEDNRFYINVLMEN
jgi:hypothetical protein